VDDPSLRPVRVLVEEHLAQVTSSWEAGAPGALATLTRLPDEPAQRGPNSLVTPQGGIRLVLPDDAVAVAYEAPSERDPLRWEQVVAFCVRDPARACRTVVTELGPDRDALRPRDLGGVLFDLGLGVPTADVCVRATDRATLEALRDAAGSGIGDGLAGLTFHVVVETAVGRLELTHPQPGSGLRLMSFRTAAPHLPEGFTSVLRLRPAHPAESPDGRPAPFDLDRHLAWQAILAEHGDPLLGVLAADVTDAVRAMRGPETMPVPDDPAARATVAVTLRRLALTDGMSGTLTTWRSRFG
jgi:hypothetical protein